MGLPSLFPWSTYSQGDLLLLFLLNISTQPNRILRCCYPSESLLIAVYLLKLGAVLILWRRMCEAKIWRATLYEGNPKPNFLNRQSLRSSMGCMLFWGSYRYPNSHPICDPLPTTFLDHTSLQYQHNI